MDYDTRISCLHDIVHIFKEFKWQEIDFLSSMNTINIFDKSKNSPNYYLYGNFANYLWAKSSDREDEFLDNFGFPTSLEICIYTSNKHNIFENGNLSRCFDVIIHKTMGELNRVIIEKGNLFTVKLERNILTINYKDIPEILCSVTFLSEPEGFTKIIEGFQVLDLESLKLKSHNCAFLESLSPEVSHGHKFVWDSTLRKFVLKG